MIKHSLICSLVVFFISCSKTYESKNLEVEKVSKHVYKHTSFFHTVHYGTLGCNGMVVVSNREAIVFDSPINKKAAQELINWIENDLKYTIKKVIPTHYHIDCIGGLSEFHKKHISSYANETTIDIIETKKLPLPQHSFKGSREFKVGNQKVMVDFLGEGHSKDNIIAYLPSDRVLFGGCLIREFNGTKGNIRDANLNAWSTTVQKIKEKYRDATVIIPGHGRMGGRELLDYTIELFKN